MKIPPALIQAVRDRNAILFAGAGLSCTLGLPLFNVLTARLSEELGISPHGIDYPVLAEYYFMTAGKRDEFVRWLRETWHPRRIAIQDSQPHADIVALDFPVIYTTNYDAWIERAFEAHGRRYRKIVHVEDLAETKPGETEIIKFHGDLQDPDSIILTESSFLRRMALQDPLDLRLRSDSLARPILFVGYSLSDPNIRVLLFQLRELWARYADAKRKPGSYILMVERDQVQERLLADRGVEAITADEADATTGLTKFFCELRRQVEHA